VIWLVRFLESWYDKDELIHRAKRHIDALCKGDYHPKGAYYLTEALAWTGKLDRELEHELICETREFLEEKDVNLVSELSQSDKELLDKYKRCFNEKNYSECLGLLLTIKNRESVYNNFGIVYYELKEHREAEEYWLMAVEKGDADAMRNLGVLYHNEFKDKKKAEEYWLMAVEKGHADAMTYLGILYENEFKAYDKAEKYYLMAVEKGDVDAMTYLGILYENEFKAYDKAEKYYLMAVEKGHLDAINNLGNLYHITLKDYAKAEKYYLMGVEKGHVPATYNLGNLYRYDLKDYVKAEKYYKMALKKKDVQAMFNLGCMYHFELKDYDKAKKYYLMANRRGHKDATNNLGSLYEHRFKDYIKAEKYYLMAIKKGDQLAMSNLAWMYFEQKINKQKALVYAEASLHRNIHVLACIYTWNSKYTRAFQLVKENMYKFSKDQTIIYLSLLLAKEQYQHVAQHFEDPELNLKERFKPLYYALLHFTDNKDFHKMPPELAEPVKDIIEKVKQMAVDYA